MMERSCHCTSQHFSKWSLQELSPSFSLLCILPSAGTQVFFVPVASKGMSPRFRSGRRKKLEQALGENMTRRDTKEFPPIFFCRIKMFQGKNCLFRRKGEQEFTAAEVESSRERKLPGENKTREGREGGKESTLRRMIRQFLQFSMGKVRYSQGIGNF